MKKTFLSLALVLAVVSTLFTGCGSSDGSDTMQETTTSFNELASYYDELAKGDIGVEVETTAISKYFEFTGDANLLPVGVYDILNDIANRRYTSIYSKYGKEFTCPKITFVIDSGYSADSPCYAVERTVYINPNWFTDNPKDYDSLLCAIFQTMQEYASDIDIPEWIESSLRCCIRDEYKTNYADEKWGLPTAYDGNSYEKGDIYGAAFLVWIDKGVERDLVYRLNKALLEGTYNESFWENETGLTFGQLWSQYKSA